MTRQQLSDELKKTGSDPVVPYALSRIDPGLVKIQEHIVEARIKYRAAEMATATATAVAGSALQYDAVRLSSEVDASVRQLRTEMEKHAGRIDDDIASLVAQQLAVSTRMADRRKALEIRLGVERQLNETRRRYDDLDREWLDRRRRRLEAESICERAMADAEIARGTLAVTPIEQPTPANGGMSVRPNTPRILLLTALAGIVAAIGVASVADRRALGRERKVESRSRRLKSARRAEREIAVAKPR